MTKTNWKQLYPKALVPWEKHVSQSWSTLEKAIYMKLDFYKQKEMKIRKETEVQEEIHTLYKWEARNPQLTKKIETKQERCYCK